MPELYWQPWLGHLMGLRPADLADMTPQQLHACLTYARRSKLIEG